MRTTMSKVFYGNSIELLVSAAYKWADRHRIQPFSIYISRVDWDKYQLSITLG